MDNDLETEIVCGSSHLYDFNYGTKTLAENMILYAYMCHKEGEKNSGREIGPTILE